MQNRTVMSKLMFAKGQIFFLSKCTETVTCAYTCIRVKFNILVARKMQMEVYKASNKQSDVAKLVSKMLLQIRFQKLSTITAKFFYDQMINIKIIIIYTEHQHKMYKISQNLVIGQQSLYKILYELYNLKL